MTGCPYTVICTCDLTPPHNFLRETHHRSYATAQKAIKKARCDFRGSPGLRIDLIKPSKDPPRTAWARILESS